MDFGAITFNQDNSITLESGSNPRQISGMDALMQTVIIELLSDPAITGGGSGFITALQSARLGSSEIKAALRSRIRTAQENIFSYQQDSNPSDDEKLKRLDLVDVQVNDEGDGWEAGIIVENVSGEVQTQTLG